MTAATAEWLTTDYYDVLGVPETASQKDITRAYRRLARELHPDTRADSSADTSDDRFKAVAAAYAVLSDEQKRREYDELRAAARQRRSAARGHPRGVRVTRRSAGPSDDVFGAPFADVFGTAFGSPFDQVFGTSHRARSGRRPERGADQEASLRLPFEQAVRGTTVDLVVDDPGAGSRTVTARIPPGVRDGQTVRLPGKGGASIEGGPPGDLLVHVQVDPHPLLGRDGRDLTVQVPVTFPEAALGADVPVPTLDGTVTVRIPPGTASGTTLRVRGRGVPAGRRSPAGDLLVTVQVDVPQRLSDAERRAVEQLAAALEDDPRRRLAA